MQILNEALLRMLVGIQGLPARLKDEEGQTLAEYGLIIALIAVAVITLAVFAFRGAIVGAFDAATTCLGAVASASTC